jgi:hypothetical protein
MPKPRPNPQSLPTLRPERAIPLLEQLVIDAEKLRQEPPYAPAREQFEHTGESLLVAALGEPNPAVQAFSTAQCGVSNLHDTTQVRFKLANEQLDGMLAALRSGIEQLRWTLPAPSHVFLPAGSTHDAYVEIRKIVAQATKSIIIVDGYVDQTLWTLLGNVTPSALVRILTSQMKGDFVLEAKKFAMQHHCKIEVRTNNSYHDRFVVLDQTKCWHLGASIKDAGNKAFAMSEILSPSIVASVLQDVEATWNASMVVPI